MKPIFKTTIFVLLLFCLFTSTYGASYYFSTSIGNDSRSNSEAQNMSTPWKSIDKLNSIIRTLQPGDVVYFRRGEEFVGTINMNSSGSASNPIKFSAYGSGPAPIITSLVRVQGWRALGNGVFESNQTFDMTELELVLIDGQQQERGRYPNRDQFNGGYLNISSNTGNSSLTSNQLSGAPNFNGGEIVIRKNHWIIDRHPISNHSGNTILFSGSSTYRPSNSFGFFVQNHINTLDRFGEWFYNRNNKKLYAFFGSSSPDNYNVQIPIRNNLFVKGYGSSNFQIENLHFKGSNQDAISIAGGRNISIRNNTIEFSGLNGILSLSILELKIEGNVINYSNNNGVFLRYGNTGAHVLNNQIRNTAVFQGAMGNGDGAGIGIYAISENTKVEYNEVINTGYSGIYFGGNSTEIAHNYIENFCISKGDGGGIYSYGSFSASRGRENKIFNNIILNGKGGLPGVNSSSVKKIGHGHGIFLDDNVSNTIVTNNTIGNIEDSGIKLANVRNLRVENNTIFNSDKALAIGSSNTGGDVRDLTIQKNIIFPKEQDQQAYSIMSDKNDIGQFGNINENYFFKPFGDPFHIFVRYNNGTSFVQNTLDLGRWRRAFGKDQNSNHATVSFERFKVNNSIGDNLFKNGNFVSNIVGVFCNSCQSNWVRGLLSPGSLRVQTPSSSTVVIPLGSVKKNGNYVAKIRARANKNGTIRVFLRHSGSPWQVVSPSTALQLTTNNQEFSVLLRPYDNIENAAILIETDEQSFDYWLEDVDIRESNISEIRPADRILFEYNNSKGEKRIPLDGTYIDAKGQNFSGTVNLPAYHSLVLFKTSSDIPRETISAPSISITSPTSSASLENGKNLTITTSVNPNGNEIKEVVFYNGNQIIGRSSSSPYTLQWNNPTPGDLKLKASVYLPSNISYDSEIVNAKLVLVGGDGSTADPGNGQNPLTEAIYINTGSTRDATFKGIMFQSEFSDRFFIGGNIEGSEMASSEPMMQTQRFARTLRYNILVPNGNYQVKTYHNEVYFGIAVPRRGPNLRVFDISIEGNVVRNDLDMAVEFPNGNGELSFDQIEVRDGVLNIELIASIGDAAISGIAIIPSNSTVQPPPPSGSTPNPNTNVIYQINTGSTRDGLYKNSTFETEFNKMLFENGNIESYTSNDVDPMLLSQRFGKSLRYRLPIQNGTYTVKTYHNEAFFGKKVERKGPNLRVFSISLQGRLVKSNMDLFLESNDKPLELTFNEVVVTNGVLTVDLSATIGDAAISGFSVLSNSQNLNDPENRVESKFPQNGIFINAGSTRKSSFMEAEFASDFQNRFFNGGNIEQYSTASPHELLQSQRFGRFVNYDVPVPNGTYTVVSYHNEVYFGNGGNPPKRPGLRVFNISIEGRSLKSNIDMHLENNGGAIEFIYENITVNDGVLNFAMTSVVGDAAISGLAIFSSSASKYQSYANLRQTTEEKNLESTMDFDVPVNSSKIVLYPNPATDEINVKIGRESEGATLYIHNSMGQNMLTQKFSEGSSNYGSFKIPLSGFSPGIYFISIHDVNGRFEKEKFVVK